MLPPDAYELIGKVVGERLGAICTEYRAEIAEQRSVIAQQSAEIADLKAYRAELFMEMRKDVGDFISTAANEIARTVAAAETRVAELKDGKDGLDGIQGEKGETGPRGEPGERGEKGEAGVNGRDGKDGAAGEAGPAGDRGEKGDPGEPGRDGVITEKVAAYQDVWKADEEYTVGDFVTWSGSLWHCNGNDQHDGPIKSKPGESDDWTLAVKRGRDGKDGTNGKDGAKGEKGETGYYKGVRDGES